MEERHELLLRAVEAVLLPLARLCVAQGLPFDRIEEVLKQAYVDAAREAKRAAGVVGTRDVSQVSMATGLSRREVARLSAHADSGVGRRGATRPSAVNQLYLRWSTAKRLRASDGQPLALPRNGRAPSFESLAQSITRHVHPRSLLDEMLRLGLATLSEDGQTVRLEPGRYVPEKDEAQLFDYLGANVGDHLAAATANVAGRGQRHFEQAIFADELSEATAQAVRQLAARQWSRVLAEVVPELERLVAEDQAAGRGAGHRARIGMFTFHEAEKDDGNPSDPQP
jgi:Family of unknown function (DUF6502)